MQEAVPGNRPIGGEVDCPVGGEVGDPEDGPVGGEEGDPDDGPVGGEVGSTVGNKSWRSWDNNWLTGCA